VEAKIGDRRATDYLFEGAGQQLFSSDHIETTATHGTGCILSSAIAANLALGKSLADSVAIAKDFVTKAIKTAPMLGHGHSPINIS
jgi:hydroxymethylpyrimidine/phosphomethylpyrimidine kinase